MKLPSDEPLFDVSPPEAMRLQCSHCEANVLLPEDGARLAGWRVIHTTSQTGAPYHDVACGSCSGRGEYVPPPSWDWRCKNCGFQFSDTYRPPVDAPLLTVDEAYAHALKHRCEPDIEFLPPGSSKWLPDWEPSIVLSLSPDPEP